MSETPGHTPCVLTPDCGPHRGWTGHCGLCHSGYGTGLFGAHGHEAPWLAVARPILGPDSTYWPPMSPLPG